MMGLGRSFDEVERGFTTGGLGLREVISAEGGLCCLYEEVWLGFLLLVLEEPTAWSSLGVTAKDVKVFWRGWEGLSPGEQLVRARRFVEGGLMSLMYHFLGTAGFIFDFLFLFLVLFII